MPRCSDGLYNFIRFKRKKMLSVNIPVFNIDVTALAQQLVQQAEMLGIDYEIRIYDDGSGGQTKQANSSLKAQSRIIYRELEQNLGRAAIRNKMGFDSQKNYLLFIDADSKLISDDYLKKYLDQAVPGIVMCGGTAYSADKPADEKLLRWVYGRRREAVPAEKRTQKKSFIITSNNFFIDRNLFLKIHFRENIGPYGHEDTLLGFDLFSAGVLPLQIDNPVEHTGLEDSGIFLRKTGEALKNLHFILENIAGDSPEFKKHVGFLAQYEKVTKVIPEAILFRLFRAVRHPIHKNRTGTNPRLFLFDIYRAGYFAALRKEQSIAKD